MNIFTLSKHPRINARALDDKRLNKMILETAQIICTVINLDEGHQATPYKNSHVSHPITKWAQSIDNTRWLYLLGIAYGEEIIYRKGRKHSCHLVLEGLTFKWPYLTMIEPELEEGDFFNGARHMKIGLDFTHLPTFEAYRHYLNAKWPNDKREPVWTRRNPPRWIDFKWKRP